MNACGQVPAAESLVSNTLGSLSSSEGSILSMVDRWADSPWYGASRILVCISEALPVKTTETQTDELEGYRVRGEE